MYNCHIIFKEFKTELLITTPTTLLPTLFLNLVNGNSILLVFWTKNPELIFLLLFSVVCW